MTKHISFAVFMLLISWFILRTREIRDVWRAIYATVPTAVVLVTLGISLYRWPITLYVTGALFFGSCIWFLWKWRCNWMFYYSVTLVTVALGVLGIVWNERI